MKKFAMFDREEQTCGRWRCGRYPMSHSTKKRQIYLT